MGLVLTNSELQSWLHCKRCWWLGYHRKIRRIRDVPRPPQSIGFFVHGALERYYRGKEHPVDSIKEKSLALIAQFPDFGTEIAKSAEMAGIMTDGYMQWLEEEGHDADLEVFAAEQKIEVPLGETGHVLRGKLDARAVRRSSGARVFLEHKTVQNLKDLVKTAQTNHQFLSYSLLEYLDMINRGAQDERTDGVLLNMLRKVKRTARATPPFYAREPVWFNLHEIRNHYRHVVSWAKEIETAHARLDSGEDFQYVVPPTSTRECFWRCNYSDLCMSGLFDDGSDVEGYIAELYETFDPLARYEEEDEDVESEAS